MDITDATRSGPHRIRTSDSERELVAEILRAAMTEGRLTLAEGEERLAGVYAARYRDELAPLTADLPDGGRRALANTPRGRTERRRRLARHAGAVGVLAVVLIVLWASSGAHFFWPLIPLGFLMLSLLRHARHGYRFAHHHRYGHRHW